MALWLMCVHCKATLLVRRLSLCVVGANHEELAVVDLIAEREGEEPQQRKKWSKVLDAFGALAFAIAPLHSTFIQHIDRVICHLVCLLTLHCALSRRVVKGILQVPQDRLWLLREMAEATLYLSRSKSASTPRTPAVHREVARMYPGPKFVDLFDTCFSCDGTPHIACHECKVLHCALHASILCQSEICGGTLARRAHARHLFGPVPHQWPFRGRTKGAHFAQCSYLCLAVLETHTLRY